jgi:copper homeostasis protein
LTTLIPAPLFTIEIVATSVQSAINGQTGGARRVELCSALGTAGITPSSGLIQLVRQYITIPVYVLIRPREGDFCYSRVELETIRRDIENAKVMGADGIVTGLLDEHNEVAIKKMRDVVQWALPMKTVFHRAFDITPHLLESAEAVIETGCERILTSGGASSGQAGIDMIRQLAAKTEGRISIMPGGGITAESIGGVFTKGITDYHLSARKPVSPKNTATLFDMHYAETDADTVKAVVRQAKAFFMP